MINFLNIIKYNCIQLLEVCTLNVIDVVQGYTPEQIIVTLADVYAAYDQFVFLIS